MCSSYADLYNITYKCDRVYIIRKYVINRCLEKNEYVPYENKKKKIVYEHVRCLFSSNSDTFCLPKKAL